MNAYLRFQQVDTIYFKEAEQMSLFVQCKNSNPGFMKEERVSIEKYN